MDQINTKELETDVFNDISEIRDIVASANMGIWRIELVDGAQPRMYVDETMKRLLGTDGQERSPEKTYVDWFSNIAKEAVPSVLESVERMKQGYNDENTYQWIHPTKGVRFVRCGGTAQKIKGGYSLRGYHYDVDEIVRRQKEQESELEKALDTQHEYYETLDTLGSIFYSMHVINLLTDTVAEYTSRNQVKEIVDHENGATEMMVKIMSETISNQHKEAVLEFTDLTTLADRMQGKKMISWQFLGKNVGWILASFVSMEQDEQDRPTKVICTTRIIDEQKKLEESLVRKSQTDELTGLLNRRAYEEDIYEKNDIANEEFIYVSLDVNGLKVVNDSLGHMAGDELIIGSCSCMKKSLGPYGKIYRTGGDEFVAILSCNENKGKEVLAEFEETVASWSGELVKSISVSYGWISRAEKPDLSVRQLGAIAEQRMYEAKAAHYKKIGMDRRGQQDAHKALCALYTKILKINVSEDTYQIVNMDESESASDKGFSDTISGWLKAFGESGQVYKEDLEEYFKYTDLKYIRDYFKKDKTSLHIFYRRRFADGFKKVMMEMIPSDDYSHENQSLFLYVKNIDK